MTRIPHKPHLPAGSNTRFHFPALLALLWMLTGCIHTYPDPLAAVDPTEVSLDLLLNFDEDWVELPSLYPDPEQSETRAESWPRRLYINIHDSNGKSRAFTHVVEPHEIVGNLFRLSIPFGLNAGQYKVAVWADYEHPVTGEPLGYDISDPGHIRELSQRGLESAGRSCLTAIETIDLRDLDGTHEAKAERSLTLKSPVARFRLIAEDYDEFMALTEPARKQGDSYRVKVTYESMIPSAFNLWEDDAADPTAGCDFTSDIWVSTLPDVDVSIGSDWLFNPPGRHHHTVTVTVLNSASVVMSEIKGIIFPTERGKITTVRGNMLTNLLTGGIEIDNIWAGEIIIEIE